MENVSNPLIEMFTDDPVNWVKWAVVFTVLIGCFILAVKIYGKIEYHLSIQKKADKARAKGHVIEIMGVTEVNTPPYMFLEDEDFQNCFRIEFEKTK